MDYVDPSKRDEKQTLDELWAARHTLTDDGLLHASELALDFVTDAMLIQGHMAPDSQLPVGAQIELTRARWYLAKLEVRRSKFGALPTDIKHPGPGPLPSYPVVITQTPPDHRERRPFTRPVRDNPQA